MDRSRRRPGTRKVLCDVEDRGVLRVGAQVFACWKPCGRRASKLISLTPPIRTCRRHEVMLAAGVPVVGAALALALQTGPAATQTPSERSIVDSEAAQASAAEARREEVRRRALALREEKERRISALKRDLGG